MKRFIKIWLVFFLIFVLGIIGVIASVNKTLNKKTLPEFSNPTYSEVLEDSSFSD